MATSLEVKREEHGHRSSFFLEKDGARVAEMTMSRVNPTLVMIDHTEVSDTLRGQGAGRQLLDAAVAWARSTNAKFIPVCPFAKAQFDKDPSIRDVLSR
jgi:predicted GNAT family acetyltransferase